MLEIAKILLKFQQTLLASALNCRRITVATVKCGRMLGDGEEDSSRDTGKHGK